MTGEQSGLLMLALAGGFIAFLAFLNDRALERHKREEAETARLHPAE